MVSKWMITATKVTSVYAFWSRVRMIGMYFVIAAARMPTVASTVSVSPIPNDLITAVMVL